MNNKKFYLSQINYYNYELSVARCRAYFFEELLKKIDYNLLLENGNTRTINRFVYNNTELIYNYLKNLNDLYCLSIIYSHLSCKTSDLIEPIFNQLYDTTEEQFEVVLSKYKEVQ